MTIVSLPFFLFVAALVLLYYLAPGKFRWVVLLLGSCLFYWLNSGLLLLVLLGTALLSFLIGLWIETLNDRLRRELKERGGELSKEEKKARKDAVKKRSKAILLLGILLVLGALLFLKYFNFFTENLNRLFPDPSGEDRFPTLHLLLPLGISFYTLQAIAYMVDIYRGKIRADRNVLKFVLFMSFFPQIVQGPIPRHAQLAGQLYEGHKFDYREFCFGIQLMLWGLTKKLVLADLLALPVNALFQNYKDYTGPILFLASLLYGFQIYADFSGGMDIARGVSQMLGIRLELNFKQPYFAASIEDFWRRWHITLGGWMRDYVFYPLSLSKGFTNLSRKCRKLLGQYVGKRLPAFLSMFIVYFLVGFWHGAQWKYVAYGLWNSLFIMSGILLENVYRVTREKCGIAENAFTWRVFRILRTTVIVSFGRYFTRSHRLMDALNMLKLSFQNWRDLSFLLDGTLMNLGLDHAHWHLLLLMLLLLFFVDLLHERGFSIRDSIARQPLVFRWLIYIAAVLLPLVFGGYGPGYDAASFIYEQF